jgi:hypothetical protein
MKTNYFTSFDECDLLFVHAYAGSSSGNAGDDPIARLMPGTGNQGGIRVSGRQDNRRLVVLYTTGKDVNWVDRLDGSNGQLTYFGGNQAPSDIFCLLMQSDRTRIQPFFLFRHYPRPESHWTVRLGGLVVPSGNRRAPSTSLDTVWQGKDGRSFQNYRACLTVLDDQVITRGWIRSIVAGTPDDVVAPVPWKAWRDNGIYQPLRRTTSGEDA